MTVNLLVLVRDHCLLNNQIQIMSVIVNKLMFTTRVIYTMFIKQEQEPELFLLLFV